jgi:RNA polymerase sigma-70 factor (ECF subfamily)
MEDAEDVSQEVFVEVFRSAGRYKHGSSLYTWIYRITINRSLDQLRKRKRRSVLQYFGSLLPGSGDGNPAEPLADDTTNEDHERRKVLEAAVGTLPENQRIAFVLSKYDDLSHKEIAEVMNLSLSSVESLIHRAKTGLQKKLADYFSEYAKKTR